MSMARVWLEREKSEANKCKRYDGRGKTESQIHGNADSRIYGFTEIMNGIKTL